MYQVKSWSDYKETYRGESDIFDFVRVGDFRGLVGVLSTQADLNINQTNSRGYSPLMLAVYHGEKDCAEALLRCGADVHSTDPMGNTVLMAAAFKGKQGVAELLLSFGADIQARNKTGMTALDWAVMFGRKEMVSFLGELVTEEKPASKLKNAFRFIRLSLLMVGSKLTKKA